jgi:hypothetical protein
MAEDALPTFVAGFDERHWGGSQAIILVAPPTSLLTGLVDARSARRVDAVKADLVARIDRFIRSLPPTHSDLQSMKTFMGIIAGVLPQDLVISAELARHDLGTYVPGWRDRMSSVFMMGIPNGSTTLKLFEQPNQRPHELHLRMPAGHYAASYWTLHESAFHPDNVKTFSSAPAVPDPGAAQGGRSAKYPFGSFGNMAKSFRWEG